MKNHISEEATITKNVSFETPVRIYGNARIKKNVQIGAFSFVNRGTELFSNTKVGRFCSIGKNCEIGAFDHPLEWLTTSPVQYNMKLHFPSVFKSKPELSKLNQIDQLQPLLGMMFGYLQK